MRSRLQLEGRTFGRLTVVRFAGVKHGTRWECSCACGASAVVDGSKLTGGKTRSCGCLMREARRALKPKFKHGHTTGKSSPTYRTWYAMIQRCTNPRSASWATHGARGVSVCEQWRTFAGFLADMGERPDGKTLDRIDNTRGYEPGNCRWATAHEQRVNQTTTRLSAEDLPRIREMRASGKTWPEIGKAFGVHRSTVRCAAIGKSWRAIATHEEE